LTLDAPVFKSVRSESETDRKDAFSDCDEHPWTGAPDPTCVIDPTRCVHAAGDHRETAENTARHLQEVRNILATMWWRFTEAGDASHAEQANACLGAVIAAEATMQAADAYMAHPTKATRAALARACRRRTS
jgi:hypothetical protein